MLLPLRWILYGTAAVVETITTGRPSAKLRRKLRRLAQWSEAIAPPRVDVIAPVQGIQLAAPRLAPARVSVAAPIAVPVVQLRVATPILSIATPVSLPALEIEVENVSVEAGIDLFDYEIAALMAA
jgi:hypothetical protein